MERIASTNRKWRARTNDRQEAVWRHILPCLLAKPPLFSLTQLVNWISWSPRVTESIPACTRFSSSIRIRPTVIANSSWHEIKAKLYRNDATIVLTKRESSSIFMAVRAGAWVMFRKQTRTCWTACASLSRLQEGWQDIKPTPWRPWCH